MQSYINVSNINTQLKSICCCNTAKLPTKKISLYSPSILLPSSNNVKTKQTNASTTTIQSEKSNLGKYHSTDKQNKMSKKELFFFSENNNPLNYIQHGGFTNESTVRYVVQRNPCKPIWYQHAHIQYNAGNSIPIVFLSGLFNSISELP